MGDIMKKVLLILLLILSTLLTSCYSTEGLEQYVGTYKIGTDYKKEYHYYWGKSTLKSDNHLITGNFTVEIKDDASAILTYDNGDTKTGRVSCSKEAINFHGLGSIDNYTFKYTVSDYEIRLDYSYTQTKIGVEYDYISERFTLYRKQSTSLKETYTFTYVMAQYTALYM